MNRVQAIKTVADKIGLSEIEGTLVDPTIHAVTWGPMRGRDARGRSQQDGSQGHLCSGCSSRHPRIGPRRGRGLHLREVRPRR
jgi:hypothetical protein